MIAVQSFAFITISLAAGLFGWAGTLLLIRIAPHLGLVQGPNERSSHSTPTPRGGGIAITLAITLSWLVLAWFGVPSLWLSASLVLIIGLLGFSDDLMDLSPALRFPIQAVVFSVVVWSIGAPPLSLPNTGIVLDGWAVAAFLVVAGVWWLNLFNFMDGIDGIAATHAILVLLGAVLIWAVSDKSASQHPYFWLALSAAAATSGFLILNWPPARIFMGDAGSNSLALAVFVIALRTIDSGAIGYAAWAILPSTFVADATVTMIRRTAGGERPWRAHRRHAYQQLSRLWGHRPVTILYCTITLLWSIPLAFLSEMYSNLSWVIVATAYLPLCIFVLWARAGAATETR